MTSAAAQGEYYIGEAALARAAIREWSGQAERKAKVLELAGAHAAALEPAADAAAAGADADAAAEAPPAPDFATPLPVAKPKPKPAPAPAPAPAPLVSKPKPAARPPPAAPAPAPAGPVQLRLRLEVNDEMFELTDSDLAFLGLDPAKICELYAHKTGHPLEDSPAAARAAAARTGAAPRGQKRDASPLPLCDVRNSADKLPPKRQALATAVAGLSISAGSDGSPGERGASPPLPALRVEDEAAFSSVLLRVFGHGGEVEVARLLAELAPAMEEPRVWDCLKVFEARNRVMVANGKVFRI